MLTKSVPMEASLECGVVSNDVATPALSNDIDRRFLRPHPFTADEARRIANHEGDDVYAIPHDEGRPVAYGMLRGWDSGFETPSLGVAVRTDSHRRGFGRLMMAHLHEGARAHGAASVSLRLHPDHHGPGGIRVAWLGSTRAREGAARWPC